MDDLNIAIIATATSDGKAVGTTLDGLLGNWLTVEWSRNRLRQIKEVTGATYVMVADDEGSLVIHTHTAATTFTIPPEDTLTWPIRGRVFVVRGNAQLTITAGVGVTLLAAGRPKFRAAESMVELIKIGTNKWLMTGDASAT